MPFPPCGKPARCAAHLLAATLACSSASGLVEAQDPPAQPNWEREAANAAALRRADLAAPESWFARIRAGDPTVAADLAAQVRAIGSGPAAPVQELQLYRLTLGLAGFEARQLPAGLLQLLTDYQPRVLVPHEDHPTLGVALFDIPAAARGVRNGFERRAGTGRSAALLSVSASGWLEAFSAGSPANRRGMLDHLSQAPAAERARLRETLGERWTAEPALAEPAAELALRSRDAAAMRELLARAPGTARLHLLRGAAAQLGDAERQALLQEVVGRAPAENSAVAIALLAPGLMHRADVRDWLFDLVADPQLGLAAAHALAGTTDPETEQRLADLAARNTAQPGEAQRARLALAARSASGTRP